MAPEFLSPDNLLARAVTQLAAAYDSDFHRAVGINAREFIQKHSGDNATASRAAVLTAATTMQELVLEDLQRVFERPFIEVVVMKHLLCAHIIKMCGDGPEQFAANLAAIRDEEATKSTTTDT